MVIRSRENEKEARQYSETFLGQEDVGVKQEYYSSQGTQNKTIAIQRRTDSIQKEHVSSWEFHGYFARDSITH